MTRISLKEQYDNSSVIKQIVDLEEQIDGYDEAIEQTKQTADTAKSTADAAKSTADAATTKNTEQDARLDTIEAMDKQQNTVLAGIELKNSQQDAAISGIVDKNAEQDSAIATIQAKDTAQDAAIAAIQAKDAEQDLSISTILDTDTKQDKSIETLQTLTTSLTQQVISAVNVTDGTQNGSIMVRLTDAGGRVLTSPSYPWGQVATFALKQGAQPGYVKGQLILSDGTVIESNEFQILEVQESDIYVTSITLTPYPATGKLGGEIGYSNGNTQQINVIDVPTAPGVTSNINDLLSRMGVVESSVNDLDVRVKAIEDTPGVGAFTNSSRGTILGSSEDGKVSANEDGTGSVSGWSDVVKTAQISDMLTKTDAAATYLTKTDATSAYASKDALAQTDESVAAVSTATAEAKSVAEDAKTTANGCINNAVALTDGSGILFTRPNDETTTVKVGASVLQALASKISLDFSGFTQTGSTTTTQVYSNTAPKKSSDSTIIFDILVQKYILDTTFDQSNFYIFSSNGWTNSFCETIIKKVFANVATVSDATYTVNLGLPFSTLTNFEIGARFADNELIAITSKPTDEIYSEEFLGSGEHEVYLIDCTVS